ncbi:MAG: metallophosphoesterase family protein [bacterium JZ-2024 1]
MTYRVLHTSDHHLEGVYPDFSEAAGQKLREDAWKALESCADFARNEAADAWVICGDLLEDAHADLTAIGRLFEVINGVSPTQVVLIPGHADVASGSPYYTLPTAPGNLVVAGATGWEVVHLEGLSLLCRGGTLPEAGSRAAPRPRGKGPHPVIAFICGSFQKETQWFGEGAGIVPSEVRVTGVHTVGAGSHHAFAAVDGTPPIVYCGSPTVMDWRDAGRAPGFCFWEIPDGAPPTYQFVEVRGIRLETVDISAPNLTTARSLVRPIKTGPHLWVRARVRLATPQSVSDLENFRRSEEQKEGLTIEVVHEAPALEVRPEEPTLRAFYERLARDDYPRDEDAEESAIWTDSVVTGLQALDEARRQPRSPERNR